MDFEINRGSFCWNWLERRIEYQRHEPQQSAQMPVFSLDGELEQMLQSGVIIHAATVNQGRE